MSVKQAKEGLKDVVVIDPDTGNEVDLCVYKDPQSGGMFAVDFSFVDQDTDVVPNPFIPGEVLVLPCEGEESDDPKNHALSMMVRMLAAFFRRATIEQRSKACVECNMSAEEFHRLGLRAQEIVKELG
jgi:hypothetical protein